jgi:hypothetical protein
MKAILLSLLLASTLCLHCSSGTKNELTTEDQLHARQVGASAAAALMSQLKSTLMATLKAEGPVVALNVCQLEAGTLLHSVLEDFPECQISRRALKVRRQDNMADVDDLKAIHYFESLPETEREAADLVNKSMGRLIYYLPIRTEQACLSCHGDPSSFAPELAAKLHRLYPKDQAVGFAEGDLRGVLRVEMPSR